MGLSEICSLKSGIKIYDKGTQSLRQIMGKKTAIKNFGK